VGWTRYRSPFIAALCIKEYGVNLKKLVKASVHNYGAVVGISVLMKLGSDPGFQASWSITE
jgi:hypothetical protein